MIQDYAGQQALSAMQWQQGVNDELKKRAFNLESRMHAAEERIRQLEQHIHYPNDVIKNRMLDMQEAATKQQALYAPLRPDTAPMRSDVETILNYREFIYKIAYGDFSWHVDNVVLDDAKRLLGAHYK